MGFTISGAALSRLVVAHDSPNTDPHKLTEMYEERSEEELMYGWRWFYCGGLAVAFIFMGEGFSARTTSVMRLLTIHT